MLSELNTAPLPRWSLTRWLVEPGQDVPAEIRAALVGSLYSTLPIFFGGVLNTIAVSSLVAARINTTPFIIWACAELLLAIIRVPVLVAGRRAVSEGRRGPTDFYILLAVLWAASVGYGGFISILSGDWMVAALACLSSAAMVGGICFRNFAAPRLVGVMIFLTLGPCALAGILSGEPIMMVTALQIPFYLFSMSVAARHLNKMLVGTMRAEIDSARRARHDDLTGLLNRAGLTEAIKHRLRKGERLALFYLDLDGFKAVNDSLGHLAGDELLIAVAERLNGLTRAEDLVARIGGDEFVLVAAINDAAAALRFGDRVVESVGSTPYLLGNDAATIGVSAGVAFFPAGGGELAAVLRAADRALYKAKSAGRLRCVVTPEAVPAIAA